MKKEVKIRTAFTDDAEQISVVQVQTWLSTYRGFIADDFLNRMNVSSSTNFWKKVINDKNNNVIVAETDKIIGYINFGKGRDKKEFVGEIYALYVLPMNQGQGIGRLLMNEAVEILLKNGFNSLYLWVLTKNIASRKFYEMLGGEIIDVKNIEVDGKLYEHTSYGWRNLNKLIFRKD